MGRADSADSPRCAAVVTSHTPTGYGATRHEAMRKRTKSSQKGMVCDYCGATRAQVMFCIGASRADRPDWTMWEGTALVSCPDCHAKGHQASIDCLDRHVKEFNQAAGGA